MIDLQPVGMLWAMLFEAMSLVILCRLVRMTTPQSGLHWRGLLGALGVAYVRKVAILIDHFFGLGVSGVAAEVEAVVVPVLISALVFLSVLWAQHYAESFTKAYRERTEKLSGVRQGPA